MKTMSADTVHSGERKGAIAELPKVRNYANYRQYLRDYYQVRKAADREFSLRAFAKKAKFPSHTLLKYLMEGKRNLSQKTLFKLCQAMEFSKEETQYFEHLVFFNQANSLEEQQFYYEKLVAAAGGSKF